jgi:hypothetical protein
MISVRVYIHTVVESRERRRDVYRIIVKVRYGWLGGQKRT